MGNGGHVSRSVGVVRTGAVERLLRGILSSHERANQRAVLSGNVRDHQKTSESVGVAGKIDCNWERHNVFVKEDRLSRARLAKLLRRC